MGSWWNIEIWKVLWEQEMGTEGTTEKIAGKQKHKRISIHYDQANAHGFIFMNIWKKSSHIVPLCGRHLAERHDPLLAHVKGEDDKQTERRYNSRAQIFQQSWTPAETLGFYFCSILHSEELIDYAEVNEEYKVKGHDESYAVPM